VLYSVGIMVLVSFILLGVAPRTLGRQNADAVALAAARPLSVLTTVLGPIPQVMILIGNAVTPGKGFADGPFSSEAELRELVDYAEASDVIEAGERKMIHSVFDLGDTIDRLALVAVAAPDQPLDKDDLGALIAGLTAKTLILNGQRDETAPAAADWYRTRLTSARVEMVPGDAALSLSAVWGRVLSHVAPRTQR